VVVAKGLEVTGTILPFSAAVRGVVMDVRPLGNMGKVPLDEGDSSANGGNAKGGNANSADEGDNSG
jgi:hypothetical protein